MAMQIIFMKIDLQMSEIDPKTVVTDEKTINRRNT